MLNWCFYENDVKCNIVCYNIRCSACAVLLYMNLSGITSFLKVIAITVPARYMSLEHIYLNKKYVPRKWPMLTITADTRTYNANWNSCILITQNSMQLLPFSLTLSSFCGAVEIQSLDNRTCQAVWQIITRLAKHVG